MKKILMIDIVEKNNIQRFKLSILEVFNKEEIYDFFNIKQGWQPTGNGDDKLYFLPGCTVPRFKVRDKFTCTVKPDAATAIFISENQLEGNEKSFLYYDECIRVLKGKADEYISYAHDQHIKALYNSLSEGMEDVYFTKHFRNNYMYSTGITQYSLYNCVSYSYNSDSLYVIPKNSALNKITCDVYYEEDLLNVLNEGKLVINPEKYEELRAFALAEDDENMNLMMELMSNSDFNKSLPYLLCLVKEFGQKMISMKISSHVNFKSLLTYLGLTKNEVRHHIMLHTLTDILKEKKKFTRTNAFLLTTLFAGENINYEHNLNSEWEPGPVLKKEHLNLLT